MTHTPRVQNVTRVYRSAAPSDIADGRAWYREAHAHACQLAARHGVTVDAAAGVIAALSPRLGWGPNLSAADRALADGRASRVLSNSARAADRIIAGEAPADVLRGPKVSAFYRLIASAGAARAVCVDRHAYDVAVGRVLTDADRTLTPKQYARVAECYVRAAEILSRESGRTVVPSEVQAVTWVAWRHAKRSAGAFDPRRS